MLREGFSTEVASDVNTVAQLFDLVAMHLIEMVNLEVGFSVPIILVCMVLKR